jgi:hypothetical protein
MLKKELVLKVEVEERKAKRNDNKDATSYHTS